MNRESWGKAMKIQSYKDLEVWKKGIEIVKTVYELTRRFPKCELFGLISQMQRAAVSIPANVAEGYARQYSKEFSRFCSISLGSCSELETLVIIAKEQRYLTENDFIRISEFLDHESRMLMSLTKKLAH
ncbi:MAG TPA: four helix bundle protein [bacterium]|nr:four helix bundle protein [bacterium]